MSENHVRSKTSKKKEHKGKASKAQAPVERIDLKNNSTRKAEENNNVNKSPTLNNNDEIIEEFDFSDTDLKELSMESEHSLNKRVKKKNNGADDYSDNNGDNYFKVDDDDDNKSATKASSTTVIAEEHQVDAAIVLAVDDCNSSYPSASASIVDKRKVTPAQLELKAATPDAPVVVVDSYCPITPRRIVDVDEAISDSESHMRSKKPKASADLKEQHATNDTAQNADDDYDNYDDEPDDELLVQFLGEANRIAEARLAARRQARAEAREIRMRELERQQKEQEQNADRVFDMHTASGIDPLSRSRLAIGIGSSPVSGVLNSTRGSSMSSRRSSEDSLEEEGRSLRDIRHELKDVEERFRKAMIANAQLDNERASQTFQIQLLKDKLEEMEESYAQLQREFKDKSRDYNALKRNLDKLNEELKLVQGQLNERDALIVEQGLVIVAVENEDGTDAKRALVSVENAQLLGSVQGSLDVRLKKFIEEKQQLLGEVQQLQEQLENYKSQGKGRGNSLNGPLGSDEDYEAQREANKIISDYKYKLQKAEQEIASLQASLARSETQVIRYKSTAEAAEKAEAELKIERRKLQRENREAMESLEELETSNNHLQKRLDKLKNAKSALLKDL